MTAIEASCLLVTNKMGERGNEGLVTVSFYSAIEYIPMSLLYCQLTAGQHRE